MPYAKIEFIERKFPSCNMVLVKDEKPIIIDTGFGSDREETKRLIENAGVKLEDLYLIVNTHYHTDHVGGNYFIQKHYGTKIAAHKWDANITNSVDLESGLSIYLDQPLEQYKIDVRLEDGDEINTGNKTFQVLHTPGHTLGHISLYEPDDQVLIVGDLFHRNDVGWINIFREGVGAIHRSIESLKRLRKLPVKLAYSGHGPKIDEPQKSIDQAIERYKRWISNPENVGWHSLKRIFAYTLIIKNGLQKNEVNDYLVKSGWFRDIATHIFQTKPEQFVQPLLNEMIRSQAAMWHGDRLISTTPYNLADPSWMKEDIKPNDWEKIHL